MRLFIQPTETLLFRTGHPFNAGESNYAETIFPPTPETWQGAIRAAIATHWDLTRTLSENFQQAALVALIGDQEQYGRFCITNITLGRRSKTVSSGGPLERLYPMPAHLVQEEWGQKRQARLTPVAQTTATYTNLPDGMRLLYPNIALQGKIEPMKGWLTGHGLNNALQGTCPIEAHDIVDTAEIYVHESRLGISIDNQTKTTTEGLLYQMRTIRMNHRPEHAFVYGFVLDIRLLQSPAETLPSEQRFVADEQTQALLRLPNQGWIILGGERRAARFEILSPSDIVQNGIEHRQQGNLLYLATPAALAQGWQPATWPSIKPFAAAIERYQPIGGWLLTPDSGGGENKPLRYCVPAGSVYFFASEITLSQPFTDYGQQTGYGIAYVAQSSDVGGEMDRHKAE